MICWRLLFYWVEDKHSKCRHDAVVGLVSVSNRNYDLNLTWVLCCNIRRRNSFIVPLVPISVALSTEWELKWNLWKRQPTFRSIWGQLQSHKTWVNYAMLLWSIAAMHPVRVTTVAENRCVNGQKIKWAFLHFFHLVFKAPKIICSLHMTRLLYISSSSLNK